MVTGVGAGIVRMVWAQRRLDVSVGPERPEGVVKVEDQHAWDGETVGEG